MNLNAAMMDRVTEALDTAVKENSYDFEEETTAVEVAYDMVAYNDDFEDADPNELAPYIKLWFKLEKGRDMDLGTDAETD